MNRFVSIVIGLTFTAGAILLTVFGPTRRPDWWLTPDQRGDRLLREGQFAAAAQAFADPARRGAAYYRAGDFKAAAKAFARVPTSDGAFNAGNALLMQGKYGDAIKRYDRALTLRPDWQPAVENRAIAVVRRDRVKATGGDETGGQSKADQVVFGKEKYPQGQAVQVAGGEPMDDAELRALWLRRVQTKPAEFLRARFSFEHSQREEQPK